MESTLKGQKLLPYWKSGRRNESMLPDWVSTPLLVRCPTDCPTQPTVWYLGPAPSTIIWGGGGGGGGANPPPHPCFYTYAGGCPTNLDYSRARAYCAYSRCRWGCLDIFSLIYHVSLFFSLSLGDRPMLTEILSQRAAEPKTTNLCRCPNFCHLKLFVYYPFFVTGWAVLMD